MVNVVAFKVISVLLYMPAVRAVVPCGCIPVFGWWEGAAVVGKNYNCFSPFLSCLVVSCLVLSLPLLYFLKNA